MATIKRTAAVVPAAVMALAGVAVIFPAVSSAAGCGPGTVYDAPSDSCVVAAEPAPPPPPPPPPPPVWNGPQPWVSASICAPIPFVSLCVGV